jgi:hypothetical protein
MNFALSPPENPFFSGAVKYAPSKPRKTRFPQPQETSAPAEMYEVGTMAAPH